MDERVKELESLYQTLRQACETLSEAESFERWGRSNASLEEAAKYDAAARGAGAVSERVTRELKTLIERHRQTAPDVIPRWVAGRLQLLDEVLEREPQKKTAVELERQAWLAFARGEQGLIEPWPGSGVVIDARRRIELLGA